MTPVFSKCAVYTTIDPDRVFEAERGDEPSEVLHEKKRWVTAFKLFEEAKRDGQEFLIFFSDSRDCESLVFWARVRDMKVEDGGTYFTFSHLNGVRKRTTQDLVLLKEKRNIAPHFIRPYALVETPAFLATHSVDAAKRFHQVQQDQDADAPDLLMARGATVPAERARAAPTTVRGRAAAKGRESVISLFSWGYFGWGSSLPQLLAVTEAAERSRGFMAPVFVDVRFSRSVRAAGFRDHAFERALPADRYAWMKALGNEGIGSGGLKIHRPEAAAELLDIAIREQRQGQRRVIFFCSCESPEHCHRNQVRELVLDVARERGINLRVAEWPGGEVAAGHALKLEVDKKLFNKIARDPPRIPISEEVAVQRCSTLPWGSYIDIVCGERRLTAAVGPAHFSAGGWYLPSFVGPIEEGDSIDDLSDAVASVRASANYRAFDA